MSAISHSWKLHLANLGFADLPDTLEAGTNEIYEAFQAANDAACLAGNGLGLAGLRLVNGALIRAAGGAKGELGLGVGEAELLGALAPAAAGWLGGT